VVVLGSIFAGTDDSSGKLLYSGAILAGFDIGKVRVVGNVIGNASHMVTIAAAGAPMPTATTDYAIGVVTVLGRVVRTQILAGWLANPPGASTPDVVAVNGDAQIRQIYVGRNWVASNAVAGVRPGADGLFGTADDEVIPSSGQATILARIDRFWVQGRILGTDDTPDDHFGIVAQDFGEVRIGGTAVALQPAPAKNVKVLSPSGDVTLREV
jgi:hypothetical protein